MYKEKKLKSKIENLLLKSGSILFKVSPLEAETLIKLQTLQNQVNAHTGQAPWHHSRPKGRVQAALAPHLLAPDARYTP